MAFCGAVETLLDVEVPTRAQYLRVIHLELNRIMSPPRLARHRARSTSARSRCSGTASASARRSSTCSRCPPASACTRATSRSAASSRTSRPAASSEGARVHATIMPERVDQYVRPARPRTRSSCSACATSARCRRADAARLGVTGPLLRAAGNPWDLRKATPYSLLRGLRLQDPGRHASATTTTASACAWPRCNESVQDHRAGARRPARGPVHHRGPQGRAAAAPRAGDLDGGADPPLQARDRGLPRAAGRGLLPDRGAARRARLLRALRRLDQARARAHARPVAS